MWPGPLVRPPCRRDASAEVDEFLFRNVDPEGADFGTGHGGLGLGHGALLTCSPGAHSTSTTSGFPCSTTYVGELRRVAGAYVLHRVDRFSRDEKDLAHVDRRRWLALDLILQRPFEDIDDLFTRMLVLKGWRFRANVQAVLDDLASGNAEIVLLEIGALDSRRLLLRAAHVTLHGLVVARHRSRAARTIRARRPRPPINAVT